MASAVTTSQDLRTYLPVLYRAVERYGAPKMLVGDGAGVPRANQAKAGYRSLGIRKKKIEKRKPWQSFVGALFNVQRRMADYRFARA